VYILVCINCGFRWKSGSADWCCCPVCDSNDIAPERKIENNEKQNKNKKKSSGPVNQTV